MTDLQITTLIDLLNKSLKENEELKIHINTIMNNDIKLFNEVQNLKKLILEKFDT